MKTAVLGGSFNPVHNGHLALAGETVKLGYARILFIPAGKPPHKGIEGGASDADRIEMLSLALGEYEWAEVWDGEIRRGGTSYSIDTIRELKNKGIIEPGSRPGLIIGDDLAAGFTSWREAELLVRETEVILARRAADVDVPFPYECRRLGNPVWPYSSTQVRRLIACRGDLTAVLPPRVAAYIIEKGLYGRETT